MKVVIFFLLSLSAFCVNVVKGEQIYVSRYHGNDFPSCGKTIETACKTIGVAVTKAHWDDTIRIDGTGTLRDPYPCSSMTSNQEQIYVNKSLSFERYGENEVILQCSSTKQFLFDGRNMSQKVVIQLLGITFLNSHITVQKCSLNIESCQFKDVMSFPNVTGVIHFESFEDELSLIIRKSNLSNNGLPCIYVVGSFPKIEIIETAFSNNTATGKCARYSWIYLSVFMVLFPTQHVKYPGTSVSLTSTSFVENKAPLGGCLRIEGITSGETTDGQDHRESGTQIKNANTTLRPFFPTKHDTRKSSATGQLFLSISEGTFSNNIGGPITVISVNLVNTSITTSTFVNNSSPTNGGAIFFYETQQFVHIESSEFIDNSAQSCGSAICILFLSFAEVYSVIVRKSLFTGNVITGNSLSNDGGALTIECPYCGNHIRVRLEKVSFTYNSANSGSSALCLIGNFQNIAIVESLFIGNSMQDERFLYRWAIIHISSYRLNLILIRTFVSGNYAKRWSGGKTVEKKPILFYIHSGIQAKINITNLQYKNNKDSGIYIQVNEFAVNSSIVSITNALFENNELFSITFEAGENTLLEMKSLSFRENRFVSSNVSLFFFSSLAQGNKVTIEDAIFEKNTAPGTIVLFRLPPDALDHLECSFYDYKNEVRLNNVLFRENNALSPSVIRLESGWTALSKCQFVDNNSSYAVFVGGSSTSLELMDTVFHKTSQWEENFRGFIFYAGSGPIKLKNTTLKAEPFQDIDSYFMVTGSNSAVIDNSSSVQCPIGTLQSFRNFTHPRLNSNAYCRPTIYETMAESFTYSCKRCPSGFYSVETSRNRSCRPCPYGGNCTSSIAARPTFWGFPSLDDNESISFQQCPTDYCCPYRNVSCKYKNRRYLVSGCSGNRTGVLCGACKPGFTETLFSAQCRKSNDCNDYWFWPVMLFYSFSFSFFLLRKSSIICCIKMIFPWERPLHAEEPAGELTSDGGGYIKVIFYFYQVAGLVFVSKDSEMHLTENYLIVPVMGWFDFKAISLKGGLVCPFRGLTVVSKIFLQASQVFAVFVGILVIFLIHGAIRKLQRKHPVFPPSDQYLAATVECLLLSYSTLALTAFKALNCVSVQSTSRFLYDGHIQCWCWWQKLCAVFIFIFIIPFVLVLYHGSKMLYGKVISPKRFLYACLFPLPFAFCWMFSCRRISPRNTESRHANCEQSPLTPPNHSVNNSTPTYSTAKVIYGPFKKCIDSQGSGAVYWESILIGRRLMLISIHTFIVFPFIRMLCLSITCALILAHHLWKRPFRDPRVNHGEAASLTALLVLALINLVELIFSLNGETISREDHLCLVVLKIVEVIIVGTLPAVFFLVIFVSLLWQLIRLCKLCWVISSHLIH